MYRKETEMDFLAYNAAYKPTEFFGQYVQSFIPPWYSITAVEITQSTRKDFKHAWAWAFDQMMNENGVPYSLGDISSYCSDVRGKTLPGATSRVSEVYRSSFVQTLEWFAAQKWLASEIAAEYAMSICPTDFSLWDISTVPPPDWWPRSSSGESTAEVTQLAEFEECEKIIKSGVPDTVILGAEGAVIPHDRRKNLSTSFRLMPFAYQVRGNKLPDAELVAQFLRKSFWQKHPFSRNPLSVFAPSFDGWIPFDDGAALSRGLAIIPLLSRMESNNINLWQSWRGVHRPFFPAPALVNEGEPGSDTTSWFYKLNDRVVCRMQDWRQGTLEFNNKNEYWLHGQFSVANRKWLYGLIEQHEGRLGYVLSLKILQREHDYSEAKEIKFHKLLDVSMIAL
jgi:hypothetical protein